MYTITLHMKKATTTNTKLTRSNSVLVLYVFFSLLKEYKIGQQKYMSIVMITNSLAVDNRKNI